MRNSHLARIALAILTATAWLALAQGSPQKEVTVTVYFGGQARATLEKQVGHAAGLTAMDAVRKAARVETNDEGTFLVSIEGVANSTAQKEFWLYFVNGEPQHTGAAERKLEPGDRVLWFLRRQGTGTHAER